MEPVLGIDLGTTFSAMAWVNESGIVEIIPNREGSNLTPSVVLVENGCFTVGQEALAQALARPDDVAQWVKREMGNEQYRFQGRYTPEEISAEILRKLCRDAGESLGVPVRRAVITVPAYFTATPLEKTREAGRLAGIEVEDLLHEPEAAAIHFGIDRLQEAECVLACDLGGGTYDATVLRMEQGVLQAVRTRGSHQLGGHDWTMAMVAILTPRIRELTGLDPEDEPMDWQRLYTLCESAKCHLSTAQAATIPWICKGSTISLEVTRQQYEAKCAPLLNEVLDKTSEAVQASGISPEQIQNVLLVGGSSRLPSFGAAIERMFGKRPMRTRNPDEAVARGAALVAHGYAQKQAGTPGRIVIGGGAASSRRIVVQRRTSHALGTMAYQTSGGQIQIVYETMIPENSNVPAVVEREGFALTKRQKSFKVPVVQLDCYQQEQERLGCFRFTTDIVRECDSPIRVRFAYDAQSIPNVTALDVETGKELACERCRDTDCEKCLEIRQDLDDGRATVVLAVDCSGSMAGSKIQEAKRVLQELAEKYLELGRNWWFGLVNFGGGHEIYPSEILLKPTQSLDELRAAAEQLDADGGTPMAAGLENIREILENVPGKKLAVIITDGQPDDMNRSRQTAQTLKALDIQIATVPVGSDANRSFLSSIGDLESSIRVDASGQGMAAAVIDLLKKVY